MWASQLINLMQSARKGFSTGSLGAAAKTPCIINLLELGDFLRKKREWGQKIVLISSPILNSLVKTSKT